VHIFSQDTKAIFSVDAGLREWISREGELLLWYIMRQVFVEKNIQVTCCDYLVRRGLALPRPFMLAQ